MLLARSPPLTNFFPPEKKPLSGQEDAEQALLEWLLHQNIAFNAITSGPFHKLWSFVRGAPSVPTPKVLTTKRLDSLYEDVVARIRERLSTCSSIAITTDGWTGHNASFWSVTAQGLNGNFEIVTARLGCIPIRAPVHDAITLSIEIKNNLAKFGITPEQISAVVTDEGGAAPAIAQCFPDADEIHCAAHVLNTAVRNALDHKGPSMGFIRAVLLACKDLATLTNSSTQAHEQLTANQLAYDEPARTLKQEVVTRWHSALRCMKSVKDSKRAVSAFCHERTDASSHLVRTFALYLWPLLDCLILILGWVETTSNMLSKENSVSASTVGRAYFWLRQNLATARAALSAKNAVLPHGDSSKSLELRAKSIDMAVDFASILNAHVKTKMGLIPAEKLAYVLSPNAFVPTQGADVDVEVEQQLDIEEGITLLKTKLEAIETLGDNGTEDDDIGGDAPADPAPAALIDEDSVAAAPSPLTSNSPIDELERYLTVARHNKATINTALFWKQNQLTFPHLANIASRYLAFPATQVASERDFSAMRLMITHLRTRLSDALVNKISVVRPAIRAHYSATATTPSRSTKDVEADRVRAQSREESRREGLKRQHNRITPDPLPPVPTDDEVAEAVVAELLELVDNGERASDIDFVPPVVVRAKKKRTRRPLPTELHRSALEDRRSTRSSKEPHAKVTQEKGHHYNVSFHNLDPSEGIRIPTVYEVFGAHANLLSSEWKLSLPPDSQAKEILYCEIEATDAAKAKWPSGKQFLRHIGQIHPFALVPL